MSQAILGFALFLSALNVKADSAQDMSRRIDTIRSEIKSLQDLRLKGVDWTVQTGKHVLVLTGTTAITLLTKGHFANKNTALGTSLLAASLLESAVIKLDSDQIERTINDKRMAIAVMNEQLRTLSQQSTNQQELRRVLNEQTVKISARINDIKEEVTRLEQLKMFGVSTSLSLKQVVVGGTSAALFFLTRGKGATLSAQLGASLLAFTAAEGFVVYIDTTAVDSAIASMNEELTQLESQLK